MAGFTTHITTSTTLGIAYGAASYWWGDVPLPTSALAAALCGAAGMLPDLDSDSGRPLREMITFTASIVPMLLLHRMAEWHWSHDAMALTGIGLYLGIRYLFAGFIKRLTVHRGMFHSLPAALIAGELAFLLCESDTLAIRYLKAGAVVLGFMSHLVLDEIWSIQMYRGRIRLKSSFGTAVKFWGDSLPANLGTYAAVGLLSFLAVNDPLWMQQSLEQWRGGTQQAEHIAGRDGDSTQR
jgi:membrane-bound metal-dependent hydrolase YbcI (DUF457 family)